MSGPDAKRRRISQKGSSKTLRAPFKSPLKSTTLGVNATPLKPASASLDESTEPACPFPQASPPLNDRSMKRPIKSRSKESAVSFADPETAALIGKQQDLEREVADLRTDVDVLRQSSRIDGKKLDSELAALMGKWRGVSREAAEYLFAEAKQKIDRMGGPQAWKKSQQTGNNSFSNSYGWATDAENPNGSEAGSMSPTTEKEMAARLDIEMHPAEEGAGTRGAPKLDDEEFTMVDMLKSLNVELDIIKWDPKTSSWSE